MVGNSWAWILSALILGVTPAAEAHIWPADTILARVAARRAKLNFKGLRLNGKERRGPKLIHRIDSISAGKGRHILYPDTGDTVVESKRVQVRSDGARGPLSPEADVVATFLAKPSRDRGSHRGLSFLKRNKIDSTKIRLSRIGQRPAYVIGQGANELWIDKDMLVPVLLKTSREGASVEIQLDGYTSPLTGEWFPEIIKVTTDGQITKTVRYNKLEINPKLSSQMFNP